MTYPHSCVCRETFVLNNSYWQCCCCFIDDENMQTFYGHFPGLWFIQNWIPVQFRVNIGYTYTCTQFPRIPLLTFCWVWPIFKCVWPTLKTCIPNHHGLISNSVFKGDLMFYHCFSTCEYLLLSAFGMETNPCVPIT